VRFFADCRYRGQAYEIVTPWEGVDVGGGISAREIDGLVAAFHHLHQTRYAHSAPEEPVEIVTVRAQALGRIGAAGGAAAAATGRRGGTRMVHTGARVEEIAVRHRSEVGAEAVEGPVLVEEDYATHYIARGWQVSAIGNGHLMATRTSGRRR
jgi:N-methylhydantoinase A